MVQIRKRLRTDRHLGAEESPRGAPTPSDYGDNPSSQIVTRSRNNDAYVWTGANRSDAYTVNGLNQYTAVDGVTHSYDANGNLTSDGVRTFKYDNENRLVSRTGAAGGTTTLRYDPLGRLHEVAGTQATTEFLWDGDALVSEYDNAGTLLRRYAHGGQEGIDDPLVWTEAGGGGTHRLLHSDHQGSIVAIAEPDGSTHAINRYDEWGAPAAGNQGRFGYTGQIWLPEIGLWHYKARVLSPLHGRFMQTDPVGYDDQINLYAYAGNDPTNVVDPSGQQSDRNTCSRIGGLSCSGAYLGAPQNRRQTSSQAAVTSVAAGIGSRGAQQAAARCPACAAAALLVGGISSGAVTAYGSMVERTYVDRPSLFLRAPPEGTQQSWEGQITSGRTNRDIIMYRVWGGNAREVSRWLSPVQMSSSAQARSILSLPPGNAASLQSIVRVPAGTPLEFGRAAPAFDQPGGGIQVYLLRDFRSKTTDHPCRLIEEISMFREVEVNGKKRWVLTDDRNDIGYSYQVSLRDSKGSCVWSRDFRPESIVDLSVEPDKNRVRIWISSGYLYDLDIETGDITKIEFVK